LLGNSRSFLFRVIDMCFCAEFLKSHRHCLIRRTSTLGHSKMRVESEPHAHVELEDENAGWEGVNMDQRDIKTRFEAMQMRVGAEEPLKTLLRAAIASKLEQFADERDVVLAAAVEAVAVFGSLPTYGSSSCVAFVFAWDESGRILPEELVRHVLLSHVFCGSARQFAALGLGFLVDPHVEGNQNRNRQFMHQWAAHSQLERSVVQRRFWQLLDQVPAVAADIFEVRVPPTKHQGRRRPPAEPQRALMVVTRRGVLIVGESGDVVASHDLKHLRRWAAGSDTFTMDFGAYEEEYLVAQTTEADSLSKITAGHVDKILIHCKMSGAVLDTSSDDDEDR
jgi:PTB domain (IRS-1 type)